PAPSTKKGVLLQFTMSAFVFVEVCSYICAPFSVASNALLLMIVRNVTSRQLNAYKLPLAMLAFTGIVLSATFLLCQPCVLLHEDVILIVLLGPVIFIHPIIASICFVFLQAALILWTIQIASPLFFKMLARKEKGAVKWQVGSIVLTLAMTWLLLIVPIVVFSFESHEEIHEREGIYERIVKGQTGFDWIPSYLVYKLNAIGKVWLILLVLVCSVGCIAVAVSAVLSSSLMRLNAKLSKWATYPSVGFGQIANTARLNACSLMLLVLAPLWIFMIFAVSGQPTFSYSIPLFLGCAFLPIFNAYFVLFNIRAFRKALSKMMSFKTKPIVTVSHVSSDP
uniref:G protein-coupled receptor n=1 Tax=Haemonchus contortus TaxID=6289 RepID=A0A7I4YPM5_HAECO